MAKHTLSVSMTGLGLDPVDGARVTMDRRRAVIADTAPPINNLYRINQATNEDGEASFLLDPDDLSTYHVAKIFDLEGIPIYEKPFSMPPSDIALEDTASGAVIGGSSIQFQSEGVDQGTPTTVRIVDFVGEAVDAVFAGQTLTVSVQSGGSKGFVAITDINPTDGGNVGAKVFSDDDYVLQSCVSSTTGITVSVLAVTGQTEFKPTVLVNGVAASLTRNALTDVWEGDAEIILTGESPYTVTASHGDGATDGAEVVIEAPPVISSIIFSDAYSQGVGQTEHAAGQTLSLTITSDDEFVELEVVDASDTATTAASSTFSASTTKTITVTAANRGNTDQDLPAKVRIRNANGTWSDYVYSDASATVDGINRIKLNNTRPSVTFNTITYPGGQSALKDSESATIGVTESNVDVIAYTSPNGDISITDPAATGNKTVTRIAGNYNISTVNLQAVVTRTANATTSTTTGVVWIAHASPTIAITTPAARLRSGVTAQNHTITLTASQRVSAVALTASVGAFTGSWATANSGVTWTRVLQIADSDTKGAASFSGLSVTNLAGRVVTTIGSGDSYTVGGFVQRTVSVAAWPNREAAIGTSVTDTSKLRVTNLSKGESGSLNTSFANSVGDAVNTYTITSPSGTYNATGNLIYNRDLANATSNTTGLLQYEIEEIV